MIDQTAQLPESETSAAGKLADIAVDVAALGGAGSITYGVWLVYHPAAFIVGGLFLLIVAWLFAREAGA